MRVLLLLFILLAFGCKSNPKEVIEEKEIVTTFHFDKRSVLINGVDAHIKEVSTLVVTKKGITAAIKFSTTTVWFDEMFIAGSIYIPIDPNTKIEFIRLDPVEIHYIGGKIHILN